MYLKSLEMQGFKSFVDKTVLEFGNGITAVVGPNGSGKSNISDAVRWVLGEQSPKILRGSKMDDMIFSGTETRRSVGFAEVSLVMDNSDGALNIDFAEVKLTRRLFRSGESEYMINGASCRLKDIYMLFADTGIGKDGYSIISQGRVDEILSNKSEDRRSIFEDASGIMKYRMRKQESERKLNSTEQNLLRINDIISELEHQIEPLTKQSETAKQYLSLKYELRDIEVGVLADGISRASERLSDINKRYEEVSAQIAENEASLEKERKDNESKTEVSRKLEQQLSEVRDRGFEIEKSIERFYSEIKLNEEKISAVKDNAERLNNESFAFAGRKGELETRLQETSREIEQNEQQQDAHMEELQKAQNKYDSIMALLSEDSSKAERIKDAIVEEKLKNEQRKGEILTQESNIALLEENKRAAAEKQEQLAKQREALSRENELARQQEAEVAEKLAEARTVQEKAASDLTALKEETEKRTQEMNLINSELQSKEARYKLLKEMEENYEGYARSVKEILSLCKENADFGQGIYGAVAQLITVPQKYELAVEAALGASYQNIVTASENEAKLAINYLKEKRLGRATFMPVTAVNPRSMEPRTENRLRTMDGYCGLAAQLIRFEPHVAQVINNLLGKVAVFENLDSAIQAARTFQYDFICVTVEGDILRTTGAITGGSSENTRRTGALSRTREIPALEKEVKLLRNQYEQLWNIIGSNKARIINGELEQGDSLSAIRSLEVEYARVRSQAENTAMRLEESHSGSNAIAEETARLEKGISEARASIEDIRYEMEQAFTRMEELNKDLSAYEEKARTGADVRAALSGEITELRLKAQTVYSRIEKLKEDRQRFTDEITAMDTKFEYINTQIEEGKGQIEILQQENQRISAQVEKYLEEKTGSQGVLSELSGQKKNIDEDLAGMMDRITSITDQLSLLKEEMGRLEIRRVKAEGEVEYNTSRLWEEYELTVSGARELTGGKPVENYGACQKRISQLKNQIKELGSVNVSAIEELENTRNRYQFMTEQRKDMEEAKRKLQKIITEVDHLMKEQFTAKFKLIRENFRDVFRELFGGGKADIVLTDESNVLESGIEINVQPPGKKLQNMMLLSGGERAMTAIALLFAILRMHPSPFCLLDEIEAALDEANVYRFSQFLNRITDHTQFILVTHRKGTMEAADSIYGVTMEEKGVSRVLSMKLGRES